MTTPNEPLPVPLAPASEPTLFERWAGRVDVSGGSSACWPWLGVRKRIGVGDARYGTIMVRGKRAPAHRAAWELFRFKIPNGLWVLHRCDNPPCVNPEHLFLGTSQDNVRDKVNKGRQAQGLTHGNARFTDEQVSSVHALIADGASQRVVARALGMSQQHVSHIRSGAQRGVLSKDTAVKREHALIRPMPLRYNPIVHVALRAVATPRTLCGRGVSRSWIEEGPVQTEAILSDKFLCVRCRVALSRAAPAKGNS